MCNYDFYGPQPLICCQFKTSTSLVLFSRKTIFKTKTGLYIQVYLKVSKKVERIWRSLWAISVKNCIQLWTVTGTCTHHKGRGYLLYIHDYLLSHVFAAVQQILEVGSHRLQSNQPKTRENVLFRSSTWLVWLVLAQEWSWILTEENSSKIEL